MITSRLRKSTFLFLILILSLFSSCEEDLSHRERMEEDLKTIISDRNLNEIWAYVGSEREIERDWRFQNGFLILSDDHYYDLDKLIAYEVEIATPSQRRLILRFL